MTLLGFPRNSTGVERFEVSAGQAVAFRPLCLTDSGSAGLRHWGRRLFTFGGDFVRLCEVARVLHS